MQFYVKSVDFSDQPNVDGGDVIGAQFPDVSGSVAPVVDITHAGGSLYRFTPDDAHQFAFAETEQAADVLSAFIPGIDLQGFDGNHIALAVNLAHQF